MPRINLNLIWFSSLFALLCYSQASHSGHGSYFAHALDVIHWRGLENVDKQTLFNAAMRGMAREHDVYSAFVPRAQKERYVGELDQHLSGIGVLVEMNRETNQIMVAQTIIGTPHPAHDAGMRAGDRIVSIEGQNVVGRSLEEAVKLIRGPEGEPVAITVIHEGDEKPTELSVMRADINVDSVLGDARGKNGQIKYNMQVDPRIAYLRLTQFGDLTAEEMRKALTKLERRGGIKALIVDVRGNAGGYLTAAHSACDLFIRDGVIVTTRVRNGEIDREYRASPEGTFEAFPMVILVNGESASASEIFSGCLQDHQRATVIGVRTYGKGSVQQMFPMERNKSLLKLTTASFWRPSGTNIHRLRSATEKDEWGVHPDEGFEVELTEEQDTKRRELRRLRDAFRRKGPLDNGSKLLEADQQLKTAVEHLQSKLDETDD